MRKISSRALLLTVLAVSLIPAVGKAHEVAYSCAPSKDQSPCVKAVVDGIYTACWVRSFDGRPACSASGIVGAKAYGWPADQRYRAGYEFHVRGGPVLPKHPLPLPVWSPTGRYGAKNFSGQGSNVRYEREFVAAPTGIGAVGGCITYKAQFDVRAFAVDEVWWGFDLAAARSYHTHSVQRTFCAKKGSSR